MNLSNLKSINYYRASFSNGKLANKIFNVNIDNAVSTFFGDVERTSTFKTDSKYNKNCLLSCGSNNETLLIHQLYPVEQCYYKSAIYRIGKSARLDNTYDFLNTTNHALSTNDRFVNAILVDNVIYAIEKPSVYGRYDLNEDIYSYISANNGYVVPYAPEISTAIYDKEKIKNAIAKDDIDELLKNAVKENLSYIQYNMMYEIPGHIYNDYDSGNIAANTFKCKNNLNAQYDMAHADSHKLLNARTYSRIDHCNQLVYAIYSDDTNYTANGTKDTDVANCKYGYKCDKVEVIDKVNRFSNSSGHKTNAYSITIYSSLFSQLKDTEEKQKIADNLRSELKNVVADIVKKLAPISTLLVNVNINDLEN